MSNYPRFQSIKDENLRSHASILKKHIYQEMKPWEELT